MPSRHGELELAVRGDGTLAEEWGLRDHGRSGARSRSISASPSRCCATPRCGSERPDAAMLMGTGNLTELTAADTTGITALLLGNCSELAIGNVLVVQVSPHTRRTLQEHDAARRIMHCRPSATTACRKGYGGQLLQVHELKPFAVSAGGDCRDRRRRCATATIGSRSPRTASMSTTPTAITSPPMRCRSIPSSAWKATGRMPSTLAQELMKAEIAFLLGKRYAQDEPVELGRRRRPPAGRSDRAGGARPYAATEEGSKLMPMIREMHRDDDRAPRAWCRSPRSV